jgi:hypothetical protein
VSEKNTVVVRVLTDKSVFKAWNIYMLTLSGIRANKNDGLKYKISILDEMNQMLISGNYTQEGL